jgi:hypothetical protein
MGFEGEAGGVAERSVMEERVPLLCVHLRETYPNYSRFPDKLANPIRGIN